MKKLFICALAVGMFTACSQDETISQQSPMQISFDGAFVSNATRAAVDPSITTGSIEKFNVWGYVDNSQGTGQVFNDVDVTKNGNAWTYSPLQYWAPNNEYHFFALATNKENNYKDEVADETLAKSGIGEISFTNVDGTEDLLYSTATAETPATIKEAPAPVKFVFDHLLSKVKFTFKNGFATGYSTIKVTDITMTVPSVGTIELNKQGEYNWTADTEGADPLTLEFEAIEKGVAIAEGAKGESDNERLTIPAGADMNYTVTFNVELLQDGATILPPKAHEVIISNYELKPGFAYNFVATLTPDNVAGGLFPIEFEAEVEDWVETGDQGIFGVKEVSTPAELAEALAEGGSVKLMADMNLTEALMITKDADLHLNGYDILAESDALVVDNGAKFTVNGNGDVKAAINNDKSANALWLKHGTAYINGGNWYVGADGEKRNDCMYVGAATYKATAAEHESHLIITGGTFEAAKEEDGQYWVLNIQDDFNKAGSTITVYGGSFKNFDPANNKSENPVVNFVAEGYESVADGEYFVVKAK